MLARFEEANELASPHLQYLDYLHQGIISYQTCMSCSSAIFYPRTLCPQCGSQDLAMKASKGQGTIYASTNVQSRNGDGYNVVLIDLDEGVRVMSSLTECPRGDVIGKRVQLAVAPQEARTTATLEA